MVKLKIGVVQAPLRPDDMDPASFTQNQVVPLLKSCTVNEDVDLFVLPELCPIGYSQHTFENYLDSPDVQLQIDEIMAETARACKAYIAYGRISTGQGVCGEKQATIQHVVLNEVGAFIASYDKILLCNYGDCAETRYFSPGTALCSFSCRGFELGMLICADMRNPTLARKLVVTHHVDAILQPAAFSRDLSFRTWRSFRETRAVENSIYWVGVNYAGAYYGNSSLNPPWIDEDCEPEILGMKEGVLVGSIQRSVLDHVRTCMPYHQILSREEYCACNCCLPCQCK